MSNVKKPNIFSYHDHVEFLKDWLNYLRASHREFSIRTFAQKTNTAVGYISMILKRERQLTEKGFQKIVNHLYLNAEEKKYLNYLRVVGQSENAQIRLDTINEIMKLQKFKSNNKKENRTFEYLTKWYFVAIYEMFTLNDFSYDIEWIRSRLRKKVSIQEIKLALQFLEENNFITKQANGHWIQVTPNLDCTEGIFKVSLAEFHHQMLTEAHNSIHEVSRENRLIMGQTMAISKKDFEKVKLIIQNSIKNLNEININSLDREQVYHIEIAAFPLTKLSGEKV
ncbi:MAG: TIGR02147 family protein [Bdellovibrio sp.]